MASAGPSTALRLEQDFLGERGVPGDAYYGIHTLRALENFPISGDALYRYPGLIVALVDIKQAAALANHELGLLDAARCNAIVGACQAIREGQCRDGFVVDVIQGGAGTSTNMNANEVVCNKALELLGRKRGQYEYLHPNEHVNMSQSTNDVYPTALKIASLRSALELVAAMRRLQSSFAQKAEEFRDVLKVGRTQLQDAVPMTLGQEFSAFSAMLADDVSRLGEALDQIGEINLGATAIGTGINTHPQYAGVVLGYLRDITGLRLDTAPNLIQATQDCGAFVHLSGMVKRAAVKLSKICSDLRLLSSGPRAGLGEINLPPVQAGSSIMPGKVNPVIPEVVNQVAFEIVGNDVTVSMAAEAGQLQLNAFEPIIAYSLFRSIDHLRRACIVLDEKCVRGITANKGFLQERLEKSLALVTALNPYIGYRNSTSVAQEALHTGESVSEIVLRRGLLSPEMLEEVLRADLLTSPRLLAALPPETALRESKAIEL